jgi:hypothetical protein
LIAFQRVFLACVVARVGTGGVLVEICGVSRPPKLGLLWQGLRKGKGISGVWRATIILILLSFLLDPKSMRYTLIFLQTVDDRDALHDRLPVFHKNCDEGEHLDHPNHQRGLPFTNDQLIINIVSSGRGNEFNVDEMYLPYHVVKLV